MVVRSTLVNFSDVAETDPGQAAARVARRQVIQRVIIGIVLVLWTPFGSFAQTGWRVEPAKDDSLIQISLDGSVRLRVHTARKAGNPNEVYRLVWAVLPSDKYQLRVQVSKAPSIKSAVKQCGGDLATTGGFKRPLGWVVSDGKLVSEPADRTYGGALVITAQGSQVIRKTEIEAHKSSGFVLQAVQSSPILIYDGKYDDPKEGAREEDYSWNRLASE